MKPDRWDVVSLLGASLAGGGIWAQWSAPWACMFWGGMLLGLAAVHAQRSSSGVS
jgi:hypothetical protein